MYFCVNEFEVCVNDSMFSGNEKQKVYIHVLCLSGEVQNFTVELIIRMLLNYWREGR